VYASEYHEPFHLVTDIDKHILILKYCEGYNPAYLKPMIMRFIRTFAPVSTPEQWEKIYHLYFSQN
jgi:hypothetical protein